MNREAFIAMTGKTPEQAHEEITLEARANCMPQVDALLKAGWDFELPEIVNRKEGGDRTAAMVLAQSTKTQRLEGSQVLEHESGAQRRLE